MLKNCPHQKESSKHAHNIKEPKTMGNVAMIVCRICITIYDHQPSHDLDMVELEGNISKKFISI